jgi:hypothetical protein
MTAALEEKQERNKGGQGRNKVFRRPVMRKADAKRIPGVRLLEGSFMIINQAMAIPKERLEGARYLKEFIEEMKASGFIAKGSAEAPYRGRYGCALGRSLIRVDFYSSTARQD